MSNTRNVITGLRGFASRARDSASNLQGFKPSRRALASCALGMASCRAWSRLLLMAVAAFAIAAPSQAQAQTSAQSAAADYPAKPVRFVVSSPPGGVVDVRARRFGLRLAEVLKQPIVVENRPGASTTIGAEIVAKASPDGYTALFGGNTEVVVAPALGFPLRYDPVKDLIPVAQFTLGFPVMVVNAGLGPKTLPELIAWAKARPGELLCGTAGHGTGSHFTCELLQRTAGIKLRTVAYKGTSPMLLDTASGQVHIAIGYLAEVDRQYIQPGKVIPIGVLGERRMKRFPEVPTMTEMGHLNYEMRAWTGLFVPAGTPEPVIRKLNAAVVQVVQEPDYRAWLEATSSDVVTPTPQEFAQFTRGELERWRKLSQELGIRSE